jgi:hypothetical protein
MRQKLALLLCRPVAVEPVVDTAACLGAVERGEGSPHMGDAGSHRTQVDLTGQKLRPSGFVEQEQSHAILHRCVERFIACEAEGLDQVVHCTRYDLVPARGRGDESARRTVTTVGRQPLPSADFGHGFGGQGAFRLGPRAVVESIVAVGALRGAVSRMVVADMIPHPEYVILHSSY